MIQLVRGFRDILPEQTEFWQYAINLSKKVLHDFGYNEIYTPIVELNELFVGSIGERTDIVEKEMYTFNDSNGKLLTLRPEATASIVRAYIQHKMYKVDPVQRLYTFGPMFRRERPQKGRYRQFYQMNVEVFGLESFYIDAELIFLLNTLLSKLSIDKILVKLNSLGCAKCRPFYINYLVDRISSISSSLCNDCKRRSGSNPLRVLDCKNLSCNDSMIDITGMTGFLCDDCSKHFNGLISQLNNLGVNFEEDKKLVRGLDYYSRTIFEIHHDKLGSQSAIAGGGRYDELIQKMGGPSTAAIGFAIGFNRLIDIININYNEVSRKPILYITVLGNNAMNLAFDSKMKLNSIGINVFIGEYNKSLKSQMKHAGRMNVPYVLIIGEQELLNGKVIFRSMKDGVQSLIQVENLIDELINKLPNKQ